MRIFKIKGFMRFQRKERITDAVLIKAIRAVEQGLVDADLGRGLIKQRVARAGEGKRGGYRMLIAYRQGDRAVFLFGFAKNETDNLDDDEVAKWQRFGQGYLALPVAALTEAVTNNILTEIINGKTSKD